MATCKSCGAPIRFVLTSDRGVNIPLDIKPRKFVVLNGDGMATFVDGHTTHFETCPDADKFRKRRTTGLNQ